MARRKTADHVIAHDASKGDKAYACECLHCGAVQRFVMPMSVSVYIAAGNAFVKEHLNCKPKETGNG